MRMEKLELSYAADRSINWHNPLEKCLEIFTKVALTYNLKPAIPLLDIHLTKCVHMFAKKKCTTIYSLILMIAPNLK